MTSGSLFLVTVSSDCLLHRRPLRIGHVEEPKQDPEDHGRKSHDLVSQRPRPSPGAQRSALCESPPHQPGNQRHSLFCLGKRDTILTSMPVTVYPLGFLLGFFFLPRRGVSYLKFLRGVCAGLFTIW